MIAAGGGGRAHGEPTRLATRVGSVLLPNPIMTASGTSGTAPNWPSTARWPTSARSWSSPSRSKRGRAIPRPVHEVGASMLNSVGLQGPGLVAWVATDLQALVAAGARVVVSIWGRTVADYGRAAQIVAAAAAPRTTSGSGAGSTAARGGIVALEVNVSCPNVEDRARMFAHSAEATARVIAATECGLPRWAKLSPNVPDVTEIACRGPRRRRRRLDPGQHPSRPRRPGRGIGSTRPRCRGRGTVRGGRPPGGRARPCRSARRRFPRVDRGAGGVDTGPATWSSCRWPVPTPVQVGTATFATRGAVEVLRQVARACDGRDDERRGAAGVGPATGCRTERLSDSASGPAAGACDGAPLGEVDAGTRTRTRRT